MRHDHCLIIDVHSFSSVPLPHEPDQTPRRPEVCIGFDRFHSPFCDDADVRRAARRCSFPRTSIDLSVETLCLGGTGTPTLARGRS
jgi:hypothetical protein